MLGLVLSLPVGGVDRLDMEESGVNLFAVSIPSSSTPISVNLGGTPAGDSTESLSPLSLINLTAPLYHSSRMAS